ncbi:MAG TPA: hypothetical protein VGK29_19605 [Paludibaculum sp.]|jgi:hypothetical protein
MRIAALLVALFVIGVGIGGIVSPDSMMALRRSYYTGVGVYVAGAVRVAMGLVLVLAASRTHWPRSLRAMGIAMCLQGISANILGLERARVILEWEAVHSGLLRAGAMVALVTGGFIAFAVATKPSEVQKKLAL